MAPQTREGLVKEVNSKERLKAKYSALAALADPMKVRVRGHQFDEAVTTPVVIEDEFEKLKPPRAPDRVLDSIGVGETGQGQKGRKIRAGRGKMRDEGTRPRGAYSYCRTQNRRCSSGAKNLARRSDRYCEKLNTGSAGPRRRSGKADGFLRICHKEIGAW